MSLQLQARSCVPEDTARVARAIFPERDVVMRMDDELGMLVCAAAFADIFPKEGQPAESPVRLALVTFLPFWEGLIDRQAANAVRTRIDGSTCAVWSSPTSAFTIPSCVNSALGCCPTAPSDASSMPCSPWPKRAGC